MLKNEIINDIKFRQQCGKYGLDWDNFEIYDEVILLNTPIKDLYVILDKNYNTIAIENIDIEKFDPAYKVEIDDVVRDKYYGYCHYTDVVPNGENFGYPFENFTLKQIIDLSHKIEIMETNHGHSLSIKINGEYYERQSRKYEEYFQLLSYIKFLGEEIKNYFLTSYHLQALGFKVPDVYAYVRKLISQVNNSINHYIEKNKRPFPTFILSSIGLNSRELNFDGMLFDVIDLLMNDKGFKVKSGKPEEIEAFDKPDSQPSLSVLANQLLKILDYVDLEQKEEAIESDISLDKDPSLNKQIKNDDLK